ncbi:cytochrome P450 1A4 isoform X3 [Numida meleagris]|uniref:cytochrome P450 1A4 isoform X3 n=1 Tax=Numida meleagris TaxID=8996 RepID=UPI000B3DCCF7|nr:cytochrome P450 1A4 isoform X3 [Numida meleagris]
MGPEEVMVQVGSPGLISATEVLVAAATFCLLLLLTQTCRQRVPKGLRSPPGPRGLPVLGSVLELRKDPHLVLTQLSRKYGDVMEVTIGSRPVVVLSGLETIRQALVRQAEDFMGRPDLPSFKYISDGHSLAFSAEWGDAWKARRKLAQNALKTFSITASPTASSSCLLEEHVTTEASYLVTKFLQLMEEKQSFDPNKYLVVSVANVICAICFGKRYDHNDQELLSVVSMNNEFGDVAAAGNPSDFIPLLRYLPSRAMAAFKDVNTRFSAFIQKIVRDHYTTFDKEHIRDVTDSLIGHCQEKKTGENVRVRPSDESIIAIVNDLFGAGFDTVTTALSWSLMYLVTYPHIQKKIQAELDQTIGQERRPRLSDRGMLPYTEAFILEMFRHSSFMPFTIPHSTTRDTVLNGYYIPKDRCVFINQWQVNHDEKLWKDPQTFNPERFLNAEGTELNKVDAEKVMTFGLGKRRCIGEVIGRWEVFLFLSTLLQQLEFSICDGKKADMTPIYGLTIKHKRCEHFQVKKRFSMKSSN